MRALVQQLAERLNQLAAVQATANEAAQAQHAAAEERADSFPAALAVVRDEVALLRWQAEHQQHKQQDAIDKLQLELFELRTGRGSAGPQPLSQRPLPPPALSRRLDAAAASSTIAAAARHAVAEPTATEHKQPEQSYGTRHEEEERKQPSATHAAQ
jgi:hypothetical protein